MPNTLKLRLSAMMFLQYFVMGATIPILSLYMKDHLGFAPVQIGVILAMGAAGMCVAPLVDALFGERLLGPERFLAVAQLAAACVMFLLSRQKEFLQFWALYSVYALVFMPTVALTNAVAFHHVPDSKRGFGGIRMWGTVGWVAIAWLFGYVWLGAGGGLDDALTFSAVSSVVYGGYALTLPRTRVRGTFSLWKAVRMFGKPDLVLLCAVTFVAGIVHQYFYYGMSPFLSHIGFAEKHIMPAMSLGQVSEVVVLGMLGICLVKLGVKRALIIGLLTQALRYVVFAYGRHKLLMIAVMPTHGFCYGFFFTAAYIYVDSHSNPATRGSVQQLYTIIVSGIGPFVGFLFAGKVAQFFTQPYGGAIDYVPFWLVPAALALAAALAIAVFFRETEPEAPDPGH
ncbi:MAG TPA: MFS transporter [Candidatus Hydrogenedentes bacterium]|nr:MFS transporter [Candidatus Hydrogenedentota bacterium]HIJ74840.1 MFS transporter [Candidatus Hydrogenedentota bacterium]